MILGGSRLAGAQLLPLSLQQRELRRNIPAASNHDLHILSANQAAFRAVRPICRLTLQAGRRPNALGTALQAAKRGGLKPAAKRTQRSKLPLPSPSLTESPFVASEEQQRAIDTVLAGRNLFLTGCAGTGKSATLLHLRSKLMRKHGSKEEYERRVAVVAMTGLAATIIEGVTLHSLLKLGMAKTFEDFERMTTDVKLLQVLLNLRTLILDEAGMMSAEMLHMLDQCLTVARKRAALAGVARGLVAKERADEYLARFDKPFGGLQLILSGDFFQLAPIEERPGAPSGVPAPPEPHGPARSHRHNSRHQPFRNRGFMFQVPVFHYGGFTVVELTKVFRQEEAEFVGLLNHIRCGSDADAAASLAKLLAECSRELDCSDGIKPTRLFSTNAKVSDRNEKELAALPGSPEDFEAVDEVRVTQEPPPAVFAPLGSEGLLTAEQLEKLGQDLEAAASAQSYDLVLKALEPRAQARARELRREWRRKAAAQLREVGKKAGGLFRDCQAIETVRLKVGAQVMLVRNVDLEANLANGSRGVVVRFDDVDGADIGLAAAIANRIEGENQEGYGGEVQQWFAGHSQLPVVKFVNGAETKILPFAFTAFVPGNGVCVRVQMPLKLAWAITVHKSQGMTLDRVVVDLNNHFSHGMTYTALSRAKGMQGLQVDGRSSRRMDARVRYWWEAHRAGRRYIDTSHYPPGDPDPWCWRDKRQQLASTPQHPNATMWFERGPDAYFAWQEEQWRREDEQRRQREEEEAEAARRRTEEKAARQQEEEEEARRQEESEAARRQEEEAGGVLPGLPSLLAGLGGRPGQLPAPPGPPPRAQAPGPAVAGPCTAADPHTAGQPGTAQAEEAELLPEVPPVRSGQEDSGSEGPSDGQGEEEQGVRGQARRVADGLGSARRQLAVLHFRKGPVKKEELLGPMSELHRWEEEARRLLEQLGG